MSSSYTGLFSFRENYGLVEQKYITLNSTIDNNTYIIIYSSDQLKLHLLN